MTRFVVAPQWQGSPAPRAMLLRDGADAIAGDLPRGATTVLAAPLEAGDALGTGIRRLSSIRRIAEQIAAALENADERVIVVGGDCSVSIAALAPHARDDLALVWIDAHADLHEPATSPSGALAGMALRAIVGGVPDALATTAVRPDRVILVGPREIDGTEAAYLAEAGMPLLGAGDLADPESILRAVRATGASRVYVHVDLDAIDPAEFRGAAWGVPFGLPVAGLAAALSRLKAGMPLVGATVAGFAPASEEAAIEDLGAILRIIGALA